MIIESEGTGFSFFIHTENDRGTEWFVPGDEEINFILKSFQLAHPIAVRLIQIARSNGQSTSSAFDRALTAVLEQLPTEKDNIVRKVQTVQDLVKLSQEVLRYISLNPGIYDIPTMKRD